MSPAAPSDKSALPPAPVSVALAVAVTFAFRDLYSVDMDAFLLPWFAHIREAGPIGAFASPFSNYTPPYLYLLAAASPLAAMLSAVTVIKLVSLLGQIALTLATGRMLVALRHPQAWRAGALIALAPTVILNSTLMTQCDAFWAAMLAMAMAAAIERRHAAMFAWCGLAVAFKAQAAFIAPFFLALAIARRIPFRLWLAAPAAIVAAMVPAMLAGWPAGDLLTIYLRQSQWESALALNAPNLWMIAQELGGAGPERFGALATMIAIVAAGACAGVFARWLREADATTMLRAALLCALVIPGLLPRMHERYFFFADVLALALFGVRPREWKPALLVQLGSGLGLLAYLSGVGMLAVYGALAMILATWLVARSLIAPRPSSSVPPAQILPA